MKVNCLSEIFFEKALQVAKEVDASYAATGVPLGPLHGLPVSLKDCFQIQGTDSTIGFTAFANKPANEHEESEVTNIMRQSGAVLFCKTNVPLGLMAGEVSSIDRLGQDPADAQPRPIILFTAIHQIHITEAFQVAAPQVVKVRYWH